MSQPQTIGRYQIVSELGHGAMGSVYRAQDPTMDRTVAIKTILAAALSGPLAQEYRERFIREARAAGRLSHPGIVTVYDVSEQDGTPYLVMEFVSGRSLAAAMDAGERFSIDRIYELGQQIAEALGYAHRNGVVHRDVKPANILLATAGPGEVEHAKLADLGVAKLTATQITTTGQLLGTPAFMPPEQFTGVPIDGRADLFSLGVILYWLATGDKPFAGDTITAVSYKIVHSEPPSPRRINPAVPVALERIIMKCLEKDPATRYATGEALAADLAAGHAGRDLSQTVPPAQRTASGAILAPVAHMDGDPNTTLDSDMRMQMESEAVPAPASGTLPPVPKAAARTGTIGTLGIATIAAVVIIGSLLAVSTIRHRNRARAEEEARKQEEAILAQDRAKADELAKKVAAQTDSALSAPDVNASQPGQTTQQPPSQIPAGKVAPIVSAPPLGSISSGSSPDKKTPAKSPATRGSVKTSTPGAPLQGSTPPPSQQPVSTPPVQTAPVTPTTTSQPATVTNPASAPGSGPTTPPAVAKPEAVSAADFAKLRVDDRNVPNSLSFMVLMDGKLLFQRNTLPEGQSDPKHDDDSVPPGIHEFRVIVSPGSLQVTDSNNVRFDFAAKKKLTLKIELRDSASGQTLKKSSHIDAGTSNFIISLKPTGLLGF
jgi:serine/threonine protein kinase